MSHKWLKVCFFVLCFITCNYIAIIWGTHKSFSASKLLTLEWIRSNGFGSKIAANEDKRRFTFRTRNNANDSTSSLKACQPLSLVGELKIDAVDSERSYWNEMNIKETENSNATYLGEYVIFNETRHDSRGIFVGRNDCTPSQNIAIIIPFRERESHLRILLGHLLRILRRQNNRFGVFVIEQAGNGTFNKGRLMNTGFKYALAAGQKEGFSVDCFIFQDVDLLMENDKLMYKCSGGNKVDHLSPSIDKFKYRPVCCGMTVGGVLAFERKQFQKVNGFPNNFWGWGGEDDAIEQRVLWKNLTVQRPSKELGRYTMIKHDRDALNPPINNVWKTMDEANKALDTHGLTDLNTTILQVQQFNHFVKLSVDVGKPAS